jgi:hypothetical protein
MKTLFLILIFSFISFGQKAKPIGKPKVIPTGRGRKTDAAPKPPSFTFTPATGKCSTNTGQFGAVRTIKLGMSTEQLKEIFPALSIRTYDFLPTQSATVRPYTETFSGIRLIGFEFVDDKLVSFQFDYDSDIEWASIIEFKNQVANSLKLPSDSWDSSLDRDGTGVAMTECQGFKVSTILLRTTELNYSVKVEKSNFYQEALDKERTEKEKQKKSFKP